MHTVKVHTWNKRLSRSPQKAMSHPETITTLTQEYQPAQRGIFSGDRQALHTRKKGVAFLFLLLFTILSSSFPFCYTCYDIEYCISLYTTQRQQQNIQVSRKVLVSLSHFIEFSECIRAESCPTTYLEH